MNLRAGVVSGIAGFVMGAALPIAGVTRPEVIIGWLDVRGDWNPTLFFFFAPAALTLHLAHRLARARERDGKGAPLQVPPAARVDGRLVAGAAIFGVGWALAGSCPGPAIATLANGAPWAVPFVIAMLAGLYAAEPLTATRSEKGGFPATGGGRAPTHTA